MARGTRSGRHLCPPATAASAPYAKEPNWLAPFRDSVHSVYSSGQDVWEVWIGDVPNWSAPVDPVTTTTS